MAFFKENSEQFKKAKAIENSANIQEGLYLFQIEACKVNKPNHERRIFWITEMTVLESSGQGDQRPNGVGERVAWKVDMDKISRDFQFGKIKKFLAVVDNANPEEITDEDADEVISEKNPLAGKKIRCQAYKKKTQKGGDFTELVWFGVDEQAPAQ